MDVQFDLTAEGQLQFFQEPGTSGDDVNNTFSVLMFLTTMPGMMLVLNCCS